MSLTTPQPNRQTDRQICRAAYQYLVDVRKREAVKVRLHVFVCELVCVLQHKAPPQNGDLCANVQIRRLSGSRQHEQTKSRNEDRQTYLEPITRVVILDARSLKELTQWKLLQQHRQTDTRVSLRNRDVIAVLKVPLSGSKTTNVGQVRNRKPALGVLGAVGHQPRSIPQHLQTHTYTYKRVSNRRCKEHGVGSMPCRRDHHLLEVLAWGLGTS